MSEDVMLHEPAREHHVCVDLDGTLTLTDTFAEAVLRFVRQTPGRSPDLLIWLLKGRAFAKMKVCELAPITPEDLPYNRDLIDYVTRMKAGGSKIILATGAHKTFAIQVAAHLGIFDEVHASDGIQNLVGVTKANLLAERYPGFNYAGNSKADIPVWEKSAGVIFVSNSASLLRKLQRGSVPILEVIPPRRQGLLTWLRVIRVHQWVKNLLILLPLLTSHRLTDWPTLRAGLISMLAFSLAASTIYITNDLLDIPHDRLHPRKKKRPFAAGDLSPQWGVATALCCGALALISAAMVPVAARYLLLFYVLLTTAYSFWLKRLLVADLMILVGFYVLRVFYGALATGITVSVWLLAFSLFFFLALAFVKRLSELHVHKNKLPGRGYGPDDVSLIGSLAGSSAYTSVLVFAFYINSPEVAPLYSHPQILWAICIALIYWLTRLILISNRGLLHDDPIVFAFRDSASYLTGLIIALLIYMAS